MALSIETVHALAVVQQHTGCLSLIGRDGYFVFQTPEVTRLLVLLTEEVARLDARVTELEARP